MEINELSKSEMYGHTKDLLTAELSTLSQRTNFFVVTQSLLIGALAFAFNNAFPYLFPYLISILVIVGIVFSIMTYKSGKESSEAIIRWRLIMKSYEQPEGPWTQYYSQYNQHHIAPKDRILNNAPLPYWWLLMPTLFVVLWTLVSIYIPARIWFDDSFLVVKDREWFRTLAHVLSWIITLSAFFACKYMFLKYLEWINTKFRYY